MSVMHITPNYYYSLFKILKSEVFQMTLMNVLDVGCGDRPTGDVNLDLFFYGKWNNFIIGEAHHLPFKNEAFNKVYAKNCLEHFEDPFKFFIEVKRILRKNGVLECVYHTDTRLTKKTIHNLLNLQWLSAFKWKRKLEGQDNISFGGHKWQISKKGIVELLKKTGFDKINFEAIEFSTIRMDKDRKRRKWKIFFNKYLPKWQLETRFTAIRE